MKPGMGFSQQLRMKQSLRMTQALQHAIKLLTLNQQALKDAIQEELERNPGLEIDHTSGGDEARDAARASVDEQRRPDGPEQADLEPGDRRSTEIDWERYLEASDRGARFRQGSRERVSRGDELPTYDNTLTRSESLHDHLLWQLRMSTLGEDELPIAQRIIGDIDDDGYFRGSLEAHAEDCSVPLEDAEAILLEIQKFDPPGVGARDLRECLLIQIDQLRPDDRVLRGMVADHLEALGKRKYPAVAKALGVSRERIYESMRFVRDHLEGRPARSFVTDDTRAHGQYITPDVKVRKVGEEWVVLMNQDGLPRLRISAQFEKVLRAQATQAASKDKRFVEEKLRSASWMIRSIHQRERTIKKVMEEILRQQIDFFEHGIDHLRPMVLRDIADRVGVHESTVSRVTNSKFVDTPHGILSLKFFFNAAVGDLASAAVKDKIRRLIKAENPHRPLSDDAIAQCLQETEGITLARRTVAKYRDALKIPTSSQRRKHF